MTEPHSRTTRSRAKRSKALSTTGWYLVLAAVMIVTVVPFFWAVLMSFRETSANPFPRNGPPQLVPRIGMVGWGEGLREAEREGSYTGPGGWWRDYSPAADDPEPPAYSFPLTSENYYKVSQDVPIGRYFFNSLVVSIATVLLTLILCSLAAYPLAKMRFAGRDIIFVVILSTLVFPEQLVLIPLYVMAVNVFQFQNSYFGLILPFAASGLGIFLLRQVYYSIPNDIIEAARIDGANEFGIWWRILLPLIRLGLATLAIITFVTSWNNFLWPLLMLSEPNLFTLPVGLAFLKGFFSGNLRTVAAGIVIATVPVIVVFMVFQKQFIQGLAGAVKG